MQCVSIEVIFSTQMKLESKQIIEETKIENNSKR